MYTKEDDAGALCAAIDDVVVEWPGVSQKTMFGCPSYVADGVLFAVVSEQGLALTRLTESERAKLERATAVAPFEANGRLVHRWATVDVAPHELETASPVRSALRQSYEAAVV